MKFKDFKYEHLELETINKKDLIMMKSKNHF